jgi:hypothetical protein
MSVNRIESCQMPSAVVTSVSPPYAAISVSVFVVEYHA